MASDTIQPVNAIKPMCDNESEAGGDDIKDPARRDYIAGRKHFSSGDYPQAVICFHNALLGFEEQNDVQGIANASDRLGDTCMVREEYAMALEHYKRAEAICEQEDDSFSQVSLQKKMAEAYVKSGEADKAFELYFDIVEHYRIINNPRGAVETLEKVAGLYEAVGESLNAADTYRTVASIHDNFGHASMAKDFIRRAEELE